ncbi:MAG TPA: glycerol-3-phosphate dehydrogenase/oxidase [Polyangia bacterium]|jgi:glycerol-3-phosphate dehydrogenase|nr:glycerol-3-phosphate dehydrogenase/oxidase [Polyangia bacterium]
MIPTRATTLARLAREEFELLVVGGGATGAGIARDAATRGVRVALVDAGDFAGQTSSQSSRLIHGGLRYLQYGDLRLVFEGLSERRRLMTTAPHLCRPVEFVFPGYRGERPGLFTEGVGIKLYNALALWRPPATARRLDAHEVYEIAPTLRSASLLGAQCYVDCQTDDARLVLENVLDAEAAGAAVLSHAPVRSLTRDDRGRVRGAMIYADLVEAAFPVRARVVVNATGPFSDAFDRGRHNLRPTLGVHIVVSADRLPHGGRVVVLRSPRDNRLFFVLPAGARTVIGTTDTDWTPGAERPPVPTDAIRARRADVEYLLEAANHGFPPARLGPDDVLATTAGLRPLMATSASTPSQTSREHELIHEPDGLLTIVGGKLTTLRRMGEDVVDDVVEVLRNKGREEPVGPCVTETRPLPGGGPVAPLPADGDELPPDVREHLANTYGSRVLDVLALRATAPALASRIDPELPFVWAEVVHAIQHEHAREVADVLMRRVPLFRQARDQGLGAAPLVAASLGEMLGWSSSRRQASLDAYETAVARSRAWRSDA